MSTNINIPIQPSIQQEKRKNIDQTLNHVMINKMGAKKYKATRPLIKCRLDKPSWIEFVCVRQNRMLRLSQIDVDEKFFRLWLVK